jgi:hypothetical protein
MLTPRLSAGARRSVSALSRWVVLRSPASHGRIEAWLGEGVESTAEGTDRVSEGRAVDEPSRVAHLRTAS